MRLPLLFAKHRPGSFVALASSRRFSTQSPKKTSAGNLRRHAHHPRSPTAPALIHVLRETHEAPASIQERVACAGGTNRFGEPNFRVVWGGTRLAWVGGRWTDHDANGNVLRETIELRRVPKYVPHNRWHIERWMPPESYGSPERWYEQTVEVENGQGIPALGPYPSRGDYEHCFTLETPRGEFLPLAPAACDWLVRAIEWSRRQPRGAFCEAIDARERSREREFDRFADEILSDRNEHAGLSANH